MNDIPQRLRELHGLSRLVPSIGGQQCGLESYRILANGNTLEVLHEAAERIEALETALHEIAGTRGSECAMPRVVAKRALDGEPIYESSKGGENG